jgi:hypothetical protein
LAQMNVSLLAGRGMAALYVGLLVF